MDQFCQAAKDCDSSAECAGDLICGSNNGLDWGFPAAVWDVCVEPTCEPFDPTDISGSFCSTFCPCNIGEGDCDRDDQCVGDLRCGKNNGADFGYSTPSLDVCISCPALDLTNPDGEFCSTQCVCALGEGDCDADSECAPGLICGKDNGALYGLPPSYDTCCDPADPACSSFL